MKSISLWLLSDVASADFLLVSPPGAHTVDSTSHCRDGCVAGQQTKRSQERDEELRRSSCVWQEAEDTLTLINQSGGAGPCVVGASALSLTQTGIAYSIL